MEEKIEILIDYDDGVEKCLEIAESILSNFGIKYEVKAEDLPIKIIYYKKE